MAGKFPRPKSLLTSRLAAAALAEPVPFDSRAVPRLATADGDWTVHGSQGCGCRSVLKRMDRGTALQIAGLA